MSQKTLSKKTTKKQKQSAKCWGRFSCLDTHLQTRATCKDSPVEMCMVEATNIPASTTKEAIQESPATKPISEPAISVTSQNYQLQNPSQNHQIQYQSHNYQLQTLSQI